MRLMWRALCAWWQDAGLCTKLTVPSELLDKTDVFIFDCDGVIWKGDSLIDGVPATLEMLRAAGKKIFFVTNNSTKSRKGYLAKFVGLGLDTVEAEEIFSSSFAAAAYLEQTKFKDSGKKVYIIGEVRIRSRMRLYLRHVLAHTQPPAHACRLQVGIEEELDMIGVPWIGGGSDAGKKIELKSGYALPHDENVGAVIVGFDREINYHKIQYAQLCINENEGCEFIATNLDAVTHLTDAQVRAALTKSTLNHPCPPCRPLTTLPTVRVRSGVGGQRRDDRRNQGVHRPRADPRRQAEPADDRLHRRQVRVRSRAHLHGRRPARHGHPLRAEQWAALVPHSLRRHD